MAAISLIETPLGLVKVCSDGKSIYEVSFCSDYDSEDQPDEISIAAARQLSEYFASTRNSFDFPVQQAGTKFQQQVWQELTKIKPGEPISYTTLSERMNNPLAIRATASANGKNKIMIAIPCHRVIGSRGELVGYAGELWRKKWLLDHEARLMQKGQSSLLF